MKRKITLILLIALILTSCTPQQQSSGTTIDVGSAIENMVEEDTPDISRGLMAREV